MPLLPLLAFRHTSSKAGSCGFIHRAIDIAYFGSPLGACFRSQAIQNIRSVSSFQLTPFSSALIFRLLTLLTRRSKYISIDQNVWATITTSVSRRRWGTGIGTTLYVETASAPSRQPEAVQIFWHDRRYKYRGVVMPSFKPLYFR